MSVEALNWALNDAPIPAVKRPSRSAVAFVLLGLANHAGADGRATFPSVARLVRYTRLSERTVRMCLDVLEQSGLITPTDPAIVAAYIKRGDRRPQGWDLALHLQQDAADGGVHAVHPEPVDNPDRGARGAPRGGNGVHSVQERGAPRAPEPSVNRPTDSVRPEADKRTDALEVADEHRAAADALVSGIDLAKIEPTPQQRRQIRDAVASAMSAGYTSGEVVAYLRSKLRQGRTVKYVLGAFEVARLGDIPAARPPGPPARCGDCDAKYDWDPVSARMIVDADGRERPCPRCHPKGRIAA